MFFIVSILKKFKNKSSGKHGRNGRNVKMRGARLQKHNIVDLMIFKIWENEKMKINWPLFRRC